MKLSIEANTVSAQNQLSDTDKTKYYNIPKATEKIAIIGNSITLHGIKPDIGWHGDWGMAASCPEKDFFHLVMEDYRKVHPQTSFMLVQAADWEQDFDKSPADYPFQLKDLAAYDPDTVVIRLSENCSREYCEKHDFAAGFMALCDYLADGGRRKLIITDSFWYSPWTADGIAEAANKYCGGAVKISDLGELDEMKAIGLFEHAGVAAHPGDKGMRAIADRILEKLLNL